jgi:hypothetical protein
MREKRRRNKRYIKKLRDVGGKMKRKEKERKRKENEKSTWIRSKWKCQQRERNSLHIVVTWQS